MLSDIGVGLVQCQIVLKWLETGESPYRPATSEETNSDSRYNDKPNVEFSFANQILDHTMTLCINNILSSTSRTNHRIRVIDVLFWR
jgi:hypothetical protein